MEVRPEYKRTEVGIIPVEWDLVPIREIVTDFHGGAPLKPSDFTASGIKVLPKGGVGRTGWLTIAERDQQFCSPSYAAAHRNNQVNQSYTIVVLRDLVPSGPSIGLIVRIMAPETYVLAQGVYGFKVNSRADARYLVQLSNTGWYRQIMNSIMVGSTQVHVTNTAFKRVKMPLPKAVEQDAITTALSDVDALLEALEKLIAKKRDLKQAAMQQLLTGQTRLPGFSGKWDVVPFGRAVSLRKSKIDPNRCGPLDFCLEMEHIESSTGSLAGHTTAAKGSSIKSSFEPGDVLFGRLRAYLRKFWLADRRGACSTEIWVLVADPLMILPGFLRQIVSSKGFVEAASFAYGTHMPRSDWSVVQNYDVELPTLSEQAGIATVLSDMDAEIEVLEQQLAKTRDLKQAMMQELLTGRIRLVPPEARHS